MSRANTRRIAIALLLGGALLVSHPAVSGGVVWDVGTACGYICLILFLCLYVFPVRGDGLPHGRLMALSGHRSIGWCVLAVAIIHATVLIVAEPQSARYLLPSAPLFMWCGVVALLSIIALVVSGLSARSQMRRAQPRQPHTSRSQMERPHESGSPPVQSATRRSATLHIVLAAILMLTVCAHAIGSSQLLNGALKTVVLLLLLCLPLGWYAVRRRSAPRNEHDAGSRSPARPASHIAAVGVIALLPTSTSKQLLLEPAAQPDIIAVNFPHDSHISVSCVVCHHNYVDHTGTTACIECHRRTQEQSPKIALFGGPPPAGGKGPGLRAGTAAPIKSSESTFHTFCRACHAQLALDHEKHGPTRSCSGCHQGIRSSSL
jgi:hypothetical protein